jgi:carbamoyl-phosphate synthase large subunit
MNKLNLLIPSINRVTHPSLCKCFRNNGEREIKIVGVDMNPVGIGPFIADVFYQVPPRKDPDYLDTILGICKKERIDVYYALGEEEVVAASENKSVFETIGTKVITPGATEMLSIATNKCRWHDLFVEKGIPHANYRKIDSVDKIMIAAHELGYPEKDVVFKPAVSKGGRGARIITSKNLTQEYYSDIVSVPKMSLQSFVEMLSPLKEKEFMPLLAMDYLPGSLYSVDVLSRDGQILYAIPKIRISGSASNTVNGQVDLNAEAMNLAAMACKVFNFSYMQNYEMKLDIKSKPIIYDINPRGGASVALCAAAGANIAYYAIKMVMGESIPKVNIKDKVKMIRFYDEYYE